MLLKCCMSVKKGYKMFSGRKSSTNGSQLSLSNTIPTFKDETFMRFRKDPEKSDYQVRFRIFLQRSRGSETALRLTRVNVRREKPL